MVRNGQVDFEFGPRPQDPFSHGLEIRQIYSYSFAVVCRADHPSIGARSLVQLRGYDWVLSHPIDRVSISLHKLIEAQAADGVCRVHYVRSVLGALAIVRDSDMLTMFPWPLVETPDVRGRCVALHLDEIVHESTTCLIKRRCEPLQGPALVFYEAFRKIARESLQSSDSTTRRIFSMVDRVAE